MPEEVVFMDRGELLTFEEITHFVRVAAPLGVDKLRLTGGEPLMRRDLDRLVAMLVEVPGIKDIGLTTNGLLLAGQARALRSAGLHRINISLDTLDPERFRQVSRRDGLDKVLAGIVAAKEAGFDPIKVNAVVIRGVTDVDVVPLAVFAREHGLEMRYIEYMPIGAEPWERGKVFFAHEILETLEREVAPLVPADDYDPRSPAMDFRYTDGGGKVGIIASVSRPFCMSCNRLRLTADGKIRNCLFALDETDVKHHLRTRSGRCRPGGSHPAAKRLIAPSGEGHEINTARFVKPQRTMHAIGG